MKSIRDRQPQKAAQPWHRRNKMLRLEVFYLIPALPKAKGLPISSQLAFQRFDYLNSFRLCWFAESLQMVALLINISLAGGCATWSSRDHLPFTWAQQLVIVTYFAIWLRTLPFYSLFFFLLRCNLRARICRKWMEWKGINARSDTASAAEFKWDPGLPKRAQFHTSAQSPLDYLQPAVGFGSWVLHAQI